MPMYNLIEYSSNCFETTGSLWSYFKNKWINFNADIANTNNFKSFMHKAKLLENTPADRTNRIFKKNATINVSLKYLSNFKRSLENPLINWMDKLYVLPTAGADNTNANLNNIIFTIKDAKVYVSLVTLSATQNKKRSKLLSKAFERSVYMNEYETKSENKNTTNE